MTNEYIDRVTFFSVNDLSSSHNLLNAEKILKQQKQINSSNINDILEIFHIKKFFDEQFYHPSWSANDIKEFTLTLKDYEKEIPKFIANINDSNLNTIYTQIDWYQYKPSFFELINNFNAFKRLGFDGFSQILQAEPYCIEYILTQRGIVEYYDSDIKNFLLNHPVILTENILSISEVKHHTPQPQRYLPKSLTSEDIESTILNYLSADDAHPNFVQLIVRAKNKDKFKISDKTRLKAQKLCETFTKKIFSENSSLRYGVEISFKEVMQDNKQAYIDDDHIAHFYYNFEFIKSNSQPYSLFLNFIHLFEFLDKQGRITLLSQEKDMGVFERILGIHSKHDYRNNVSFNFKDMASIAQINGYEKILSKLDTSIEEILHYIFTDFFHSNYGFANNARLLNISTTYSYFEKIRLLAPEFESILKQFKLFVEDGSIDFELIQISSLPTSIRDIPSLNSRKYLYFNTLNQNAIHYSGLICSDQSWLASVENANKNKYSNFLQLIVNEKVKFEDFYDYQKPHINDLIDMGLIKLDENDIVCINNIERVSILQDLYQNGFASFHYYDDALKREALQMEQEGLIYFESTLFSKMEQSYFNYYLNKSEFNNGLDLRNRYLHGTQGNPNDNGEHEHYYFIFLRILILTLLKIDDDLYIANILKN